MSLTSILDTLPLFKSDEILKSFIKGYSIINNPMYKHPICSISGGSDSDIMLDLIHRIDGKIVAVTVIDIFPNYLDSIYCYYDPDFSFLDLGVYTAIREIEYAKSFQELIDKNFIYYTMGEMSQSVTKLKYKGNYFPIEIMDHYTENYVFLTEKIKALIGDNECHCLFEKYNKNKDGYFSKEEIDIYINNIIIDVFGEQVLFEDLINLYLEDNSKAKNQIAVMMRKLMEIIDIETFNQIYFYYNCEEK